MSRGRPGARWAGAACPGGDAGASGRVSPSARSRSSGVDDDVDDVMSGTSRSGRKGWALVRTVAASAPATRPAREQRGLGEDEEPGLGVEIARLGRLDRRGVRPPDRVGQHRTGFHRPRLGRRAATAARYAAARSRTVRSRVSGSRPHPAAGGSRTFRRHGRIDAVTATVAPARAGSARSPSRGSSPSAGRRPG